MEDALNKLTYQIIGCAYKVHRALGPGLLESSYESCLVFELL
jgi:GxxExxY protein